MISNFNRPAVFFVNGLGDQLIALPTMRALAHLFPGTIQLMLGEGNYCFLFNAVPRQNPDPIRLWWTDPSAGKIDVGRIMQRAAPCDLFICLSTWNSPSIMELARKMGAKRSVGFFDCFNDAVLLEDYGHMFDYLFAIAQKLEPSLGFDDFNASPDYSSAAAAAAAEFVTRHMKLGERLLFVHPETSDARRMWTTQDFSWVLTHFLDERPEFRVFISSRERQKVDIGLYQDRLIEFDAHLELALASMRYADLFLGIDSCFLHAADLFRVPGVGLFGPTRPGEWGFRISRHSRHVYGEGSMSRVRRVAVLDALLEVVSEVAFEPPKAARLINA